MTSGDKYRTKAAALRAKARYERDPALRAEFEVLALSYLRLAEQAERNKQIDISYETPPIKNGDPEVR